MSSGSSPSSSPRSSLLSVSQQPSVRGQNPSVRVRADWTPPEPNRRVAYVLDDFFDAAVQRSSIGCKRTKQPERTILLFCCFVFFLLHLHWCSLRFLQMNEISHQKIRSEWQKYNSSHILFSLWRRVRLGHILPFNSFWSDRQTDTHTPNPRVRESERQVHMNPSALQVHLVEIS